MCKTPAFSFILSQQNNYLSYFEEYRYLSFSEKFVFEITIKKIETT